MPKTLSNRMSLNLNQNHKSWSGATDGSRNIHFATNRKFYRASQYYLVKPVSMGTSSNNKTFSQMLTDPNRLHKAIQEHQIWVATTMRQFQKYFP